MPTLRTQYTIARRVDGALGAVSVVPIACASAAPLLWLVGRLATDRTRETQYLYWTPTLVVIAVTSALLLVSHALFGFRVLVRRLADPTLRARPTLRAAGRARAACWTALIAMGAFASLVEFRGRGEDTNVPRAHRLRILFWNQSEPESPGWAELCASLNPDLVVIRPGGSMHFENFEKAMRAAGHDEPVHSVINWAQGFAVLGRAPVTRWAGLSLNVEQALGLDPRRSNLVRKGRDPGRGMMLTLDGTRRLGRDLTLWLVDMPSDLSLWRMAAAKEARAALGQFDGEVFEPAEASPGEAERWVRRRSNHAPFAQPDIILGDFNTPRGSASLGALTPGFANAYDQAGHGYTATFPRRIELGRYSPRRWRFPLWHLDQAFVAPGLRAVRYEIIDPGAGTHRMQLVDIAVAEQR